MRDPLFWIGITFLVVGIILGIIGLAWYLAIRNTTSTNKSTAVIIGSFGVSAIFVGIICLIIDRVPPSAYEKI